MDTQVEQLKKIIQKAIKKEVEIEMNDPLDKIVLSSLTFVIIMGEIERGYKIEIPEDEMLTENFIDLNSIIKMINRINLIK